MYLYAIITLAIFILAFLWQTLKTNTEKKPRQLPPSSTFKRKFNAEEAGKRIRRRMNYKY